MTILKGPSQCKLMRLWFLYIVCPRRRFFLRLNQSSDDTSDRALEETEERSTKGLRIVGSPGAAFIWMCKP